MGKARGVSAQSNTAGMLPPNSSDEEEPPKKGKGVTKQSETAGMMPPGSSDEESDDEPAREEEVGVFAFVGCSCVFGLSRAAEQCIGHRARARLVKSWQCVATLSL